MTKLSTRIPDPLMAEPARGAIVVLNGSGGLSPNTFPLTGYLDNTAFEPNGTGGFQFRLGENFDDDPVIDTKAGSRATAYHDTFTLKI